MDTPGSAFGAKEDTEEYVDYGDSSENAQNMWFWNMFKLIQWEDIGRAATLWTGSSSPSSSTEAASVAAQCSLSEPRSCCTMSCGARAPFLWVLILMISALTALSRAFRFAEPAQHF